MVKADPKAIGAAMRAARLADGTASKDLAMMADIHVNTLLQYETGKTVPTLVNLIALADALRISLDEYVGRSVQ